MKHFTLTFVWGAAIDSYTAHIAADTDGEALEMLCGRPADLPVCGPFPPHGLSLCARCFAHWVNTHEGFRR